ncbi:hypothetical protein FTO74_14215 [Granulicella sp. WH15]|uniref:hypothetical protein n=1 Tax=Granulicella sp. WH15 TaxID=2602070 RepID=UPI001366EE5D|nr:hypothetical protein [Granulicella sp. WH15]QHN04386.1 hypothetical protein FTO74_14215 [Granulicella sp. WH15]
MIPQSITPAQRQRLQILYAQFERHSLDCPGASREARMSWASKMIRREVASFNDLTLEEAKRLIDILQGTLGVKVPSKTKRRPQTRRDGEKAGTEGRRDQIHAENTLVGQGELRMIQRDLDRLGWDRTRLEAFLASPRGPNKGRTTILTLGDANRIHWALKRLNPNPANKERTAS